MRKWEKKLSCGLAKKNSLFGVGLGLNPSFLKSADLSLPIWLRHRLVVAAAATVAAD